MNPTTNGDGCKCGPDRWCTDCDEAIAGDADVHDGEILCGPCGLARRREEAAAELEENLQERASTDEEMAERREQYEADLFDLDRDYDEDMSALRRQRAAWDRRVADARRRLAALELPEVAPIVGGAPFEPTADDWADYREWAEGVDRECPDEAEPPMWGYE